MNTIARCPGCNRVVGAASDDMPAKDRAKYVAGWVRGGCSISQMETPDVRTADWGCRCKEGEPAAAPAAVVSHPKQKGLFPP